MITRTRSSARGRPPTRRGAYATAALVLATACAVPAAVAAVTDPGSVVLSPPEPTGPHEVGRTDLHLVDPARGHPWVDGATERDVMVSLWYPAEPDEADEHAPYVSPATGSALASDLEQVGLPRSAVDFDSSRANAFADADAALTAGPFPVVLFSPGFGVSRSLNTANAEELASQGYVVAAMDHPYEPDAVELPDGRVLRTRVPDRETPSYREAITIRTADSRLVLDALDDLAAGGSPQVGGEPLPDGLAESLDTDRTGMFGHSAGGLTTAQVMLADDRVDAGMNLDGSMAYHVGDQAWADATTEGADRPFALFMAGTAGGRDLPHTSGHHEDLRLFRSSSSGPVLELLMTHGEHMSLMDYQWVFPAVEEGRGVDHRVWRERVTGAISTVDPAASVAAQRAYVTAYFDAHLRDEEEPLLDGPSAEYPEIAFVDAP
ncbi:platelet-activating factor acetylhydrolase isoform II [Nocardiopsis sp. Huas11]|uniref:alpha/beta hydrolase family protein n=1 Tax=Nocardiopsis sp. Huas11 TaxID=2183912 RepID=UPI000EAEB086|nr:alpha/beta hydrolase [Nocardiopsis sp. Huas11]RKS05928.1 platelet-activating factor acetylhydrolase isoform II [Nocardiopsis sp. Huas11]